MIQAILGLLGLLPRAFGTIDNITNAISNERITAINAKTEAERIQAQERASALQARRDVMVAESQRSSLNAIFRGSIGASAAVLIAKLFVWDKVIGSFYHCAGDVGRNLEGCQSFRTDAITAEQWWVVTAVVGFYFLYETVTNRK